MAKSLSSEGAVPAIRAPWLEIYSAEARGLASEADLDIWERLTSVKSPSGIFLSLHRAIRIVAALAFVSAYSFPYALFGGGPSGSLPRCLG